MSPAHRSRRRALAAAALLTAAALALGGCGGSDDGSSSLADTGVTPENATATTAGGPLTQEQWDSYQAARTKAQSANKKAIATFTTCGALKNQASNEKVAQCLGTTTDTVVAAGREALASLKELPQGSDACGTANANLQGLITLYISSVQALGSSIERGQTASTNAQLTNSKEALTQARAADKAFEQACRPA